MGHHATLGRLALHKSSPPFNNSPPVCVLIATSRLNAFYTTLLLCKPRPYPAGCPAQTTILLEKDTLISKLLAAGAPAARTINKPYEATPHNWQADPLEGFTKKDRAVATFSDSPEAIASYPCRYRKRYL